MTWTAILAAILALLGGASGTSIFFHRQEVRRRGAEASGAEADAEAKRAGIYSGLADRLNDENKDLRAQVEDLWRRLRETEGKEATTQREMMALRARVEDLERGPEALLRARLQGADTWEVFEHARDGFVLTFDGRLIRVNGAFAAALGRTPAEVIAIGWQPLLHPDDLERTLVAEAAAGDRSVRVKNRYKHLDGRWIWCDWRATRYAPLAWSCVLILGCEVDA